MQDRLADALDALTRLFDLGGESPRREVGLQNPESKTEVDALIDVRARRRTPDHRSSVSSLFKIREHAHGRFNPERSENCGSGRIVERWPGRGETKHTRLDQMFDPGDSTSEFVDLRGCSVHALASADVDDLPHWIRADECIVGKQHSEGTFANRLPWAITEQGKSVERMMADEGTHLVFAAGRHKRAFEFRLPALDHPIDFARGDLPLEQEELKRRPSERFCVEGKQVHADRV